MREGRHDVSVWARVVRVRPVDVCHEARGERQHVPLAVRWCSGHTWKRAAVVERPHEYLQPNYPKDAQQEAEKSRDVGQLWQGGHEGRDERWHA